MKHLGREVSAKKTPCGAIEGGSNVVLITSDYLVGGLRLGTAREESSISD